MALPLQPDTWISWRLQRTDGDVDTYEWGTRPLADEDSFKEPRLDRIGNVRRSCATDDGEPRNPTCDIDVNDADGLIRGILAEAETAHGIGGEFAVRILSETARKAGATPSELMNGRVSKIAPLGDRRARITVAGVTGALYTEANREKTYPQQRIGEEHPYAPRESKGLVYPILIGVKSDVGATDQYGNSAEKGLMPAIDVGTVLLLADGTEVDQAEYPLEYLDAPTGLEATNDGTAGSESVTWGVSALSAYGETMIATVTLSNAPDLLNGTDSVTLTWTNPSGTLGNHVYRDGQRVVLVTGVETYTDVGAPTTGQAPPLGNTALIDVETADGTAVPRVRFVAAQKAVHVEHVYGSDLADGAEPKRTRLTRGTDVFVYGDDGYPHADPYIDIGGIRQTVFYLLPGPIAKHHREGAVNIAWNGWGVETVGDGSGTTITQLFYGWEWFLNEEVLKDGGAGHKTGTYGPAETFANGVPMLRGSKFTEAQILSAQFLNDSHGYVINYALTEPKSLRTIEREFLQTAGCIACPANRLGQYYPIVINDLAAEAALSNNLSPLQDEATMSGNLGDETVAGDAELLLAEGQRMYHHQINILRWAGENREDDKVETRVVFNGGWDNDAQTPRFEDREIAYDPETYGFQEHKQRGRREARFSDDLATLGDAQDRYLRRHLLAPRKPGFATDIGGIADDLGAEILLTHPEGSSSADGDEDLRALVIEHDTDPTPGQETVTLRVLDLTRIVAGSPLQRLQDEATMDGNLMDEDESRLPPVGAWRLR